MEKKYELTSESKTMDNGDVVYRIKAVRSFMTAIYPVKEGDLGGWVSSEDNLSHDGTCWLFDNAVNSGNSRRHDNSVGYESSWSYEDSQQFENSQQCGNSQQSGQSKQYGKSCQSGSSWQYNNSYQYGNSRQFDCRRIGMAPT